MGTPYFLCRAGIVDIDRIAAQTEENPYDILDIPHTSDIATAKNAYKKQSLKWHPDRNVDCGKRCENKMADITRAFDQIKRRQAPPPEDRTWEKRLENLVSDWTAVIKHFDGVFNEKPNADNKATRSNVRTDL